MLEKFYAWLRDILPKLTGNKSDQTTDNTVEWWIFSGVVLLILIVAGPVIAYVNDFISANMFWAIMTVFMVIPTFPIAIQWTLKEVLPMMARSNFLFTTVKKGKIKLVKLAGKVLFFISNLFDVEFREYFDPDPAHPIKSDKEFKRQYLNAVRNKRTWMYRRFVTVSKPTPEDPKNVEIKVRGLGVTRTGKTVNKLTGEIMARGKPRAKDIVVLWGNGNHRGEIIGGRLKRLSDKEDAENRTEMERTLFWRKYGVVPVGFGGSVYEYHFERTVMDADGKLEVSIELASSLYDKNVLFVVMKAGETIGMTPITIKAQVVMVTTHAGRSINFDNWVKYTRIQIQSAIRDYVALYGVRGITKQQCEEGGKLWIAIMMLNEGLKGNPGLPWMIGQAIESFSINSLDMDDDEMREALQAEALADERKKGIIKTAEGEAAAILLKANATAEAVNVVGTAKNVVLIDTAKVIGEKSAADLRQTEALSEGVRDFQGTALSLGGKAGMGIIIGDGKPNNGETSSDKKDGTEDKDNKKGGDKKQK